MLVVDLLTKDVHDDCTDTKQGTQRDNCRYSHGPSWIIAAPSGGPPTNMHHPRNSSPPNRTKLPQRLGLRWKQRGRSRWLLAPDLRRRTGYPWRVVVSDDLFG